MLARMALVRDFLEQALVVLPYDDPMSVELEELIERAIGLAYTSSFAGHKAGQNVVDFQGAAQRLRPAS
ncbi:hypothetical protein [Devosia sp. 919]|uniref:hypothetical protein n=1 Tax=Devosia sp. 919 TaxID=2726065 RepID=UPI0015558860|nr:hypothetical protein [Devosia sp. 919]